MGLGDSRIPALETSFQVQEVVHDFVASLRAPLTCVKPVVTHQILLEIPNTVGFVGGRLLQDVTGTYA